MWPRVSVAFFSAKFLAWIFDWIDNDIYRGRT